MQFRQIGFRLVQGMPAAVVVQRQHLVRRIDIAGITVLAVAVLVDVVAQMNDQVDVVAIGNFLVNVEVAMRVVGARHDGNA